MEAEQWSGPLEVVATQLELRHRVHCAHDVTSGLLEGRTLIMPDLLDNYSPEIACATAACHRASEEINTIQS